MTILHSNIVTARKEHVCDFCGGIIRKGEKYSNLAFVFDGSITSQTTHQHCQEVFGELCRHFNECGVTERDPDDMLNEYADDVLTKEENDEFMRQPITSRQNTRQWEYMYNHIKNKLNEQGNAESL